VNVIVGSFGTREQSMVGFIAGKPASCLSFLTADGVPTMTDVPVSRMPPSSLIVSPLHETESTSTTL
jgi:hypothetical protein